MVKVGKKDLKVSVVRKMLSAFNKFTKEPAIKNIWGMKTAELTEAVKQFKITDGSVKHKTKSRNWSFAIEDSHSKRVKKVKPPKAPKAPKAAKAPKKPKNKKMKKPKMKETQMEKDAKAKKEDEEYTKQYYKNKSAKMIY
jgi:hypothetical protein